MAIQVIIGSALWGILLIFATFGELFFNKVKIKSPVARFFIMLLIIPFVGIVFWGVGWLLVIVGKTIISPIMYFF